MSSNEHRPKHDHERSDWTLSWVVWSAILLVMTGALLLAGAWWVFREFQASAASRQLGTAREQAPPPPDPKLQVSPTADWNQMITKEREVLNSYGWIDRSRGTVHIPIRRAMELFVKRSGSQSSERGAQK